MFSTETARFVIDARLSCSKLLTFHTRPPASIETGPDTIDYDDRTIGIGAHPIGIDVESFRASLRDPETPPVEPRPKRRHRPKHASRLLDRGAVTL